MALSRQPEPNWRTSRYSGSSGNCVEVARTSVIHVRDTKQRGRGPELAFTERAWADFLSALRQGELE